MYLLELENSNVKMYHSEKQTILNYLDMIKNHREQMLSDAEKINDLFGNPLKKEWDVFNESLIHCTPENSDEYTKRRNEIDSKEKELFKEVAEDWVKKNNPEWNNFFLDKSDFGDISEELRFVIYEINEFPITNSDFHIFDFSAVEVERIVMYGRNSGDD